MDNSKIVEAKDLLKFQTTRNITNFYKNLLMLLEDSQVPKSVYLHIRKRILDYGNDCIRTFEQDVQNYDISIAFGKNEESAAANKSEATAPVCKTRA